MQLETSIVCLNLRPAEEPAARAAAESLWDVGACSDVGRVRQNNEDSFLTAPEMNLYVLSDGMGGLACGEVASRLTVDTIMAHCRAADADPSLGLVGRQIAGATTTSNHLVKAIRLANQVVFQASYEKTTHQGMGATAVAVRCVDQRMSVAHVGDSRAYRLRDGRLEQLTQDHSFVAELVRQGTVSERDADLGNLQNVLTRAVGTTPEVEVDIREEVFRDGDTVLLCSDGLTRELSDYQIAGILRDADNSQEAANQLVGLANEAGGGDNITAIVIRQVSSGPGAFWGVGRLSRWFSRCGNRS